MKPHPVRSASLIFTLTLLLFLPPLLYAAEVTEQDLRDAITGRRTFTQEELNAMDEKGNGDGQVDVADLVSFLASDEGKTAVFFELEESEALETAGTVGVKIFFARPYTGDVHFHVLYDEYDALAENPSNPEKPGQSICTATYGQDYLFNGVTPTAAAPGQIQAWESKITGLTNAATATLSVQLLNNSTFSFSRRIVLALHTPEGSGLRLVQNNTHALTIVEDDLPAEGYWYAVVGLNKDAAGKIMPVTVGYEFLFSLVPTGGNTLSGKVLSLKTHVPDVPILEQLEHEKSQEFSPGMTIPVGTPVTAVNNGAGSLTIHISCGLQKDVKENPFPVPLARNLTLTVALNQADKADETPIFVRSGIAVEETRGLGLPDKPFVLSGNTHLSYYSGLNSRSIIKPTEQQRKAALTKGTWDTSFTLYNTHMNQKSDLAPSTTGSPRYFFLRDCYSSYGAAYPVPPAWVSESFSRLEQLRDKGNLIDQEAPTEGMYFSYGHFENKLSQTGSWTVEINNAPVNILNPGSVFLSSAGYVKEKEFNPTIVLWNGVLGAPVAGRAYLPDPVQAITTYASGQLSEGTGFLKVDKNGRNEILTGAAAFVISNTTQFDPAKVETAEIQYLGLIEAMPFREEGPMGVMDTRMDASLAYCILVDHHINAAYKKKYEHSLDPDNKIDYTLGSGSDCLTAEIEEYKLALDEARKAADLMMALYADKQFRGVGAWLRGDIVEEAEAASSEGESVEGEGEGSNEGEEAPPSALALKLAETRRFTINAVALVAKTQYELAERRMLADFKRVVEGNTDANTALKELTSLQAYLNEVLRVLGTVSPYTEFGDNGLGLLQSWLEKTRIKIFEVTQGMNPFGFVADFVPFFADTSQEVSQTDNLNEAVQLAKSIVEDAKSYEDKAFKDEQDWITESGNYTTEVASLKTTYYDQLRALCGVIDNGAGAGDNRYEPDIFTYFLDDIAERDNVVENKLGGGRKITAYGEIGLQHENIKTAEDKIEKAYNDWNNLVKEMEITIKANAEVNASINGLAQVILDNGHTFAFYEREKGRLAAEAENKIAQAQKKGFFKKLLTGVAVVAAVAAVTIATGGAGTPFAAAIAAGTLTTAGMVGIVSGTAAIQATGQFCDYRSESITASKVGDIKAELASKTAEINAAREELAAMERAQVQFQRMEENDIRTAEALQKMMLRRANLEIDKRIAERDLLSEQLKLMDMFAKVDTLLAEYARHLKLLDPDGNSTVAWRRLDYRIAFKAAKADAEASFNRAQAATWMAIRALEYYLNGSKDTTQFYANLYAARRCDHLITMLTDITTTATEQRMGFKFDGYQREILSLKYHILANSNALVDATATDGSLADANKAPHEFTYFDSVSKTEKTGAEAYQYMLRDFLARSIRDDGSLEIVFSTDIFDRRGRTGYPATYTQPTNPLFRSSLYTGRVILGTDPPGFSSGGTLQGVELNLIGTGVPVNSYSISLTMEGDMVLRATRKDAYDPLDPMENLVYYTAYQQHVPTLLKPFGSSGDFSSLGEETIGSTRKSVLTPKLNGQALSDVHHPTQVFADASVANSRWVLLIIYEASNKTLLDNLRQALDKAYTSNDGKFDYLTDIQVSIGCVAKIKQ